MTWSASCPSWMRVNYPLFEQLPLPWRSQTFPVLQRVRDSGIGAVASGSPVQLVCTGPAVFDLLDCCCASCHRGAELLLCLLALSHVLSSSVSSSCELQPELSPAGWSDGRKEMVIQVHSGRTEVSSLPVLSGISFSW